MKSQSYSKTRYRCCQEASNISDSIFVVAGKIVISATKIYIIIYRCVHVGRKFSEAFRFQLYSVSDIGFSL